jgi:Ser/Thr protein kinase RdoA (MazF antagonist)
MQCRGLSTFKNPALRRFFAPAMPTIRQLLSRRAKVLHSKKRSHVRKRIVAFAGGKHVLYRFRNRASAGRFAETLAAAAANGAALQSPVAGPPGFLGTLIHGHWLAFSFADGEPIRAKCDEAVFRSLGESLAGLHRVSSAQPGPLLYAPELMTPNAKLGTGGAKWLEDSRARMASVRDFRLTHGDLFAGNIIVTPDAGVVLIDYELLAFDHAGVELATLLLRDFCQRRSAATALLDGYLARCDEATRETWRDMWRDFLVAAAFRMAALRERHLRRRSKLRAGNDPSASDARAIARFSQDAARHLETATMLVETIAGGIPADAVSLIAACRRNGGQSSRA